MKRVRLGLADRCWSQLLVQPPRNPRLCHQTASFATLRGELRSTSGRDGRRGNTGLLQWQMEQRRNITSRRNASSTAEAVAPSDDILAPSKPARSSAKERPSALNSPSPAKAARSAKLSALHARLSLPASLPLQVLGRCLIDSSVDGRPDYNNAALAILGQDLFAYYTTEHLICTYPRLPMPILYAAQFAYIGAPTLNALRTEWGVEAVAAPGQEVDPGLLQLERLTPGKSIVDPAVNIRLKHGKDQSIATKRAVKATSRSIVYNDEFGEVPPSGLPLPGTGVANFPDTVEDALLNPDLPTGALDIEFGSANSGAAVTVEQASAGFIRAVMGALYLTSGIEIAKQFHRDHILSRHLELHKLFDFTYPTRDVSRLCARENFEPPVARLISETGRLSRTPVFVVGVFSGEDKLGEGAGASLNEARVRAAAAALRSWYLYSPPVNEIMRPSETEGAENKNKKFKTQLIDIGEVIT